MGVVESGESSNTDKYYYTGTTTLTRKIKPGGPPERSHDDGVSVSFMAFCLCCYRTRHDMYAQHDVIFLFRRRSEAL